MSRSFKEIYGASDTITFGLKCPRVLLCTCIPASMRILWGHFHSALRLINCFTCTQNGTLWNTLKTVHVVFYLQSWRAELLAGWFSVGCLTWMVNHSVLPSWTGLSLVSYDIYESISGVQILCYYIHLLIFSQDDSH